MLLYNSNLPLFNIVSRSPLILVPFPRLIADCVQLVVVVPDPRSLIALDSFPVPVPVLIPIPVPVSLGAGSSRGSDGLEQFISLTGHLTRARGG